MRFRNGLLVFLLIGRTAVTSEGSSTTFSSGPKQVMLLELYTSERCSSCPPTEKAFAQLLDHPRLWNQVVPVSFHMTYFDTSN